MTDYEFITYTELDDGAIVRIMLCRTAAPVQVAEKVTVGATPIEV